MTEPTDVVGLREIAADLARDAGSKAAVGRRSVTALTVDTKSSRSDLVTVFDREAEASIVDWLDQHRPEDGIVGEEGSSRVGTSGLVWHIDPIDGTTNFVYDLPAWACSVAVREEEHGRDWGAGRTLAGAVFLPALDEMFDAALGQGARLNGRPLAVNPIDDVGLALVGTGFSFDTDRRRDQATGLVDFISTVRDIRRLGSAAADLCFVACGRYDAYFEAGLNSWDMAAGELIALEAGAVTTDFSGGAGGPHELVVAAPGIHDAIVTLLS